MRQDKDRCSKWMIGHHGDAILKMAGVAGFAAWRAVQAEVVAPRRLPDGLLDVTFPGRPHPDPFLIEIETYPDADADRQVFEDALLICVDRGVVPDIVSVVLHPKGQARVTGRQQRESRHQFTRLGAEWRVVELWTLHAADLFAMNDVGVVPWVPLTKFDGPPELVFQQCRDRIDRQAAPQERESLLVVSQLLAAVAYPNRSLLSIFTGDRPMIESPLLDEMKVLFSQMATHNNILDVLDARFGSVPADLAEQLRALRDDHRLKELMRWAGTCPDLEAFRLKLVGQ